QGKTNYHFDQREKSFSDPSHSLGMTDGGPSPLRAWRLGGKKSGFLVSHIHPIEFCLLMLVLFTPARASLAQERLERVTLAIPVHALSQLPAFVGSRFGLFREEGLDVQIIQMRTALVGPALISRDLDFATAADTMLRAATSGLPVKVIAFGGIKPALTLIVRREIKKPEDLKG
ncbi:MAG: ABC transporter substrate-binding protein, partial [Deltaproteobacteria bacterium]|nr:ABC transporter substrate-binding protein [Deltaproteobacteria bacterium]